MCTSYALALDGVDDGERCIQIGTWHGYACVGSLIPHGRVGTCEVALVARCGHTRGKTRVDVFDRTVALHVQECTMLDSTRDS